MNSSHDGVVRINVKSYSANYVIMASFSIMHKLQSASIIAKVLSLATNNCSSYIAKLLANIHHTCIYIEIAVLVYKITSV